MSPRSPNGHNGADRGAQRRLMLRHLSDADLHELAREVYEEAQHRAREARDIAAEFPRAFQRRCPICHSPGCTSEQCRREERRRSRWRHVPEPASNNGGRP
jgi:hypothetical protein